MPRKPTRPHRPHGRRLEVEASVTTYARGLARRRVPAEDVQAELSRQKAELFRALGQPVRLRIVEALGQGERSVTQLLRVVRTSQPNLSKHLALLRRLGIVEARKEGLNVFYRLKLLCVTDFFACVTAALRERAERSADLARHL